MSCSQNRVDHRDGSKTDNKPNVIYILADDLGYADIGAYGQKKIETPHLDRLAKNGMMFTQHYTGSTVCAPSRSSLLTGMHTGHTPIRGNKEYHPEGQHPLPDSVMTMAKIFRDNGYKTGAFGKWGLGFVDTSGDPNHQGFDEFFGYNCQRQAHRYYPEYLWENKKKTILEGNNWKDKQVYAQDLIHEKTIDFIEAAKNDPFFLYVPLVLPHAELAAPDDEIFQKYKKRFGDEDPYIAKKGGDYGADIKVAMYQSQERPRATYAAMVERLDRYVGEIVAKLEKEGITQNTIIMFASDNGPHLEGGNDPQFFDSNGQFRGHKRDLYEGGIRTAFIVKWPAKIPGGQQTDHISTFWDLLPTFADILQVKAPPQIDGISFLPTLLGKEDQPQHDFLYWEFVEKGGKQAVRQGDWKAVKLEVKRQPDREVELYNLSEDPGESTDLAKKHPDIAEKMKVLMKKSHKTNPVFPLLPTEGNTRQKAFLVD